MSRQSAACRPRSAEETPCGAGLEHTSLKAEMPDTARSLEVLDVGQVLVATDGLLVASQVLQVNEIHLDAVDFRVGETNRRAKLVETRAYLGTEIHRHPIHLLVEHHAPFCHDPDVGPPALSDDINMAFRL